MIGDVTNAGVTDATGMILSVGAPAHAVEPYSSYAVGALASNDFSSFTLTFTASDLSAVPVTIQWKDADGNTFTTTKTLDLRTLSGSGVTGSRSDQFRGKFPGARQPAVQLPGPAPVVRAVAGFSVSAAAVPGHSVRSIPSSQVRSYSSSPSLPG